MADNCSDGVPMAICGVSECFNVGTSYRDSDIPPALKIFHQFDGPTTICTYHAVACCAVVTCKAPIFPGERSRPIPTSKEHKKLVDYAALKADDFIGWNGDPARVCEPCYASWHRTRPDRKQAGCICEEKCLFAIEKSKGCVYANHPWYSRSLFGM